MDEKIKKLKRIFESMVSVLRNPLLIEELSVEINSQKLKIKELRREKNSLTEAVQNLKEDAFYFEELKEEFLEQKKQISGSMKKMLDLAVGSLMELENQEIYNLLEFIDPEGWCIYRASQEILKMDVYKEFVVEDMMGWFEESDGYELKNYLEIAAFGECSYKIVGSMHEALDSYTIDYNSHEYKSYQDKLYSITIQKLIDHLYAKEPSIKMQFLQEYMEQPGQTMADQNDQQSHVTNDITNVNSIDTEINEVSDEEMEI